MQLIDDQTVNLKKRGVIRAVILKDVFYYGKLFVNGIEFRSWGGFMNLEVARTFINRRLEVINTILELPLNNRLKPFINPNQQKGKRNARTRYRA